MVVAVIGKKGSGKTALLRKLTYRVHASRPTPLIFWHDPNEQIRDAGARVFQSVAAARSYIERHQAVPSLSLFRGRGVDVDELAQLALDVRDVVLVIDELDRACTAKKWKSPHVERIVHEGRHERVSLFGSFRRTANVHEDIVSQADYVFIFRHSLSNPWDLDNIKRRFGVRVADEVRRLPRHRFVIWEDGFESVEDLEAIAGVAEIRTAANNPPPAAEGEAI